MFRKSVMVLVFRRNIAEKNSSGWSIWKCYSLALDDDSDRLIDIKTVSFLLKFGYKLIKITLRQCEECDMLYVAVCFLPISTSAMWYTTEITSVVSCSASWNYIFFEYFAVLATKERRLSHSFPAPDKSSEAELVETPLFNCSIFRPFKLHKKLDRL